MTTFAQVSALYHQVSEEIKQKYPCLSKWEFRWNYRLRNAMGRAIRKGNGVKYIELSVEIIQLNLNAPNFLDKIRDTILHEWAHALDWENHKGWGHGPTWRLWMASLGRPPERCFDSHDWLVKPNKCEYAIRHDSGKVQAYYQSLPSSAQIQAAKTWAFARRLPIEQLSLINLNHGWSRAI